MSKPVAIVIAFHEAEQDFEIGSVGLCVLCDETAFIGKKALPGELEIEDLKQLRQAKILAFECLSSLIVNFGTLVKLPQPLREQVRDELLDKKFGITIKKK